MIHILFGNYLKKAGKLSAEQLANVYEEQKKVRVKLGLIAVAENLMTIEQADEVKSFSRFWTSVSVILPLRRGT